MSLKIIIFCSIIIIFIITLFTLLIIDKFSKSKWFCEKMGWHKAPKIIGNDGCSSTGMCPRCGQKVLQDSQGNWF